MYITEVIDRVDVMYPNEYGKEEKYRWCEDLNARIASQCLRKYGYAELQRGNDGSFLLPEGVTYEMVDRIIAGGEEISKLDFRSYGIRYLYGPHSRFLFPEFLRLRQNAGAVYLVMPEPIRDIREERTAAVFGGAFDTDAFAAGINVTKDFKAGDIINITFPSFGKTIEEVPVLDVTEQGDDWTGTSKSDDPDEKELYRERTLLVPEGTFDGVLKGKSATVDVVIERVITDQTLCQPPYDLMYADYVNMQIAYGQRDYEAYERHEMLFNTKFREYQNYVQERRTLDRDGRLENWW